MTKHTTLLIIIFVSSASPNNEEEKHMKIKHFYYILFLKFYITLNSLISMVCQY